MDYAYWRKQTASKPLFPDVVWSKPERRDQAGRLAIIGGNKLGFASVAISYQSALASGAGEVRVLLPDALKNTIPLSITDCVFAPTNHSGSLASEAIDEMQAIGAWSNGVLLIGDAGRSSETAILYEKFISEYSGPLTLTRDAIDLVKNGSRELVERPNTVFVASFAQLQKLFQNVYYPKVLTFSMQLLLVVEALHKFTVTYPCTMVVLHHDQLLIASGGEVVSQDFTSPLKIWRGETAANIASYWLWNQARPLEAAAAAIISPPTTK